MYNQQALKKGCCLLNINRTIHAIQWRSRSHLCINPHHSKPVLWVNIYILFCWISPTKDCGIFILSFCKYFAKTGWFLFFLNWLLWFFFFSWFLAQLTSQDKTAQVIQRALQKHNLEDVSEQDFTLVQVLAQGRGTENWFKRIKWVIIKLEEVLKPTVYV